MSLTFIPSRHHRRSRKPRPRRDNEKLGLVDLLAVANHYNISLLPISPQSGREILGEGASGEIEQALVDVATGLAFKTAVPSNNDENGWEDFIKELSILHHPSIRDSPLIVDILGLSFVAIGNPRTASLHSVTIKASLNTLKETLLDSPSDENRHRIFTDVIQAVQLLHQCGVAHGDIKPQNVLVNINRDNPGWVNCRLIDFGSCIAGDFKRQAHYSPPWNAPELSVSDHSTRTVAFEYLAQTDLYSLALLCIHILIPYKILSEAGVNLLEGARQGQDLVAGLCKAISHAQVHASHQELLNSIVRNIIQRENGHRQMLWDDCLKISPATNHIKMRAPQPDIQTISFPSFSRLDSPHVGHLLFKITPRLLDELDDMDYVVKQTILHSLELKAKTTQCTDCNNEYKRCIALCYLLGLGGVVAPQADPKIEDGAFKEEIQHIEAGYTGMNTLSNEMRKEFASRVLNPTDLTLVYDLDQRLANASQSLDREINARVKIFGPISACLIKLKRQLVLVEHALGELKSAEEHQKGLVSILLATVGPDHPQTLLQEVFLMSILADRGGVQEESSGTTLSEKVRRLEEILGRDHSDSIAAKYIAGHLKVTEEDFVGAETIFRDVLLLRSRSLGADHPETIKTVISLMDTVMARDKYNEAKEIGESIWETMTRRKTSGANDTIKYFMRMSRCYQKTNDRKKAMECAETARNLAQTSPLKSNADIKLEAYKREAYISRTLEEWESSIVPLETVVGMLEGSDDPYTENRSSGNFEDKKNHTLEALVDINLHRSMLTHSHLRSGQYHKALTVAKGMKLSPDLGILEKDPIRYVNCVENLAGAFLMTLDMDGAEETLINLVELTSNSLGHSHEATTKAASLLQGFLSRREDYDQGN